MVIAYHIIFGAYGFLLPNDPRGSWPTQVWAAHLQPFGDATKVDTRRSLAARPHDRQSRLDAKQHLQYPAVCFTSSQIAAVAEGFDQAICELKLDVHACSIMSDHVHAVVGRNTCTAEYIASFLKRAATRRLMEGKMHPLQHCRRADGRIPSPWVVGGWFVYLNSPPEVRSRIDYVEENPIKAGLPAQSWPFVKPFEM